MSSSLVKESDVMMPLNLPSPGAADDACWCDLDTSPATRVVRIFSRWGSAAGGAVKRVDDEEEAADDLPDDRVASPDATAECCKY
jgi:hypothetical protein